MSEFLITTGLVLLITGDLMIIARAFGITTSWGMVCLLMPPAAIPFMVVYPRKSITPALLMVAGLSAMLLSGVIGESWPQ